MIDAGVGLGNCPSEPRCLAPSARFVLNHNGSVEAFEDHFLVSTAQNGESNRDHYLRFISRYDFLLFQSADVAEEVTSIVPAFADSHLVLPPSCQEPEILGARQQPSPFVAGTASVVVVGSIQRRKGQEDAVRSLALLRPSLNATLHFVGPNVDAEYAAEVHRLADELGVASAVFAHGLRSDYARFLAHATVVLQPSSAEGVSRVLREAMLLRRPIVAYAIPGTSSVLTDGADALLAPRGDVAALAAALRRIVAHAEVAERIGAAAGSTYLRNHSWAGFLHGLSALLQSTLPVPADEGAA